MGALEVRHLGRERGGDAGECLASHPKSAVLVESSPVKHINTWPHQAQAASAERDWVLVDLPSLFPG